MIPNVYSQFIGPVHEPLDASYMDAWQNQQKLLAGYLEEIDKMKKTENISHIRQMISDDLCAISRMMLAGSEFTDKKRHIKRKVEKTG